MSAVASVKEIERLVVVIDIHAWLSYPNPSDLSHILQQTVKRVLLSVPPFCRWGFKLFDSSLSPFSSRCKIKKLLGSWAISTRFDSVLPGGDNSPSLPEVLSQFCSALNCLHTELQKDASNRKVTNSQPKASVGVSKANYVASSLLELLVDCVWNPFLHYLEDVPASASSTSSSSDNDPMTAIQSNSNLIIYMSTLPSTSEGLNNFFSLKSSCREADILPEFSSTFRKVRDSFASNNIHLCWVDIPVNISIVDNPQGISCTELIHCTPRLSSLLDNFGWSFTYLDVLLTGLRILPFSVLWNGIAHPWFHYCTKKASFGPYKLCMQVRDVKNKPMNTTLCKVEYIPMGGKHLVDKLYHNVFRISSTVCRDLLTLSAKSALAQGILKPFVAEKAMFDRFVGMHEDENDRNSLGDYVLRQLQKEGCCFEAGKPLWQLFLIYLAREKRVAVADFRVNGAFYFATIEPLTLHLALLRVFEKKLIFDSLGCSSKDVSRNQQEKIVFAVNDGEDSKPDSEFNSAISVDTVSQGTGNLMDCEATTRGTTVKIKSMNKITKPLPPLDHCSQERDISGCSGGRKRVRPSCPVRTDEASHLMILEDLYLKGNKRSKTLKAFSCWVKQTKQSKQTMNVEPSFELKNNDQAVFCKETPIEDGNRSKLLVEYGNYNQLPLERANCNELLIEDGLCTELPMEDVNCIKSSIAVIPDQWEGEQSLLCIKMENGLPSPDVYEHFDKGPNVNKQLEIKEDNNSLDCAGLVESQVTQDSTKISSTDEGSKMHDLHLNEAASYIASLEQKVTDCLSSTEIDLYCFCQRVVGDAYSAFSVVLGKDSGSTTMHKEPVLKARIVERLNQSLLQNPKKLASKYKKCRPPRSDSQESVSQELDDDHYSYTSEEKLREYELQILFRMEIIAIIGEVPETNGLVQSLVDGICRLLENIQFNLPGGVLEGESLFDFSNSAIKERYRERLPSIVDNIYMMMEFNGHDDLSEAEDFDSAKNTSDLLPSGSDAPISMGTEEDSFSNSEIHYDACSQVRKLKHHSTEISTQRKALFKSKHRGVTGLNLAEQELRLAEAKRERSKRFSHFASSSRDLLKVTVVPKNNVSVKKQIKLSSKGIKAHRSKKGCDKEQVILQTPFLSEKKPGSQRHHRSNKDACDDTEVILQTPFQTSAKSLSGKHQTSLATVKKKLLV